MKVKIKKLHPDAVLPYKNFESDFCYDVVAVSEKEVAPNIWEYGLGFSFELVRSDEPLLEVWDFGGMMHFEDGEPIHSKNYYSVNMRKALCNFSLDFRPRSSVWKTGMVLSNCEGTLDELYRGEVKAYFYHVIPDMPRYKVGDRIGQIKLGITLPLKFVEVEDLNTQTERGEGGFGSTGK